MKKIKGVSPALRPDYDHSFINEAGLQHVDMNNPTLSILEFSFQIIPDSIGPRGPINI